MPKLPLPALIGTGAVGSIGIGTALNSREKKKAAQRVAQFNQEEVKDWNRFTDNTARKSFIQQLGKDPMTDPKLLQYAENMNRLKTGSKVTEIPGDGGSSYQITKLRGSDRFGCTCNDWRYKKSVAQPGEELDCKHIKQFKQMSKTAGHVEDRIAERAPGAEAEVNTLRSKLRQMKLRKGQTYHVPLSRGKGYAVIGDIGDRHAVKTVLGPSMQPPGERLKVARAPRDYKREYEQYHAKPEQVENRSLRNQARKKLGLSKGDPREVDHKTPLSRGGGNDHANLRAVSRTINRTKFTESA
jgi:hypothetical protein